MSDGSKVEKIPVPPEGVQLPPYLVERFATLSNDRAAIKKWAEIVNESIIAKLADIRRREREGWEIIESMYEKPSIPDAWEIIDPGILREICKETEVS